MKTKLKFKTYKTNKGQRPMFTRQIESTQIQLW